MKIFEQPFWQIHFTKIIVGIFILSRLYIWFSPPPEFSEIIYSYMPYAHLWASGVQPYLDQWYEYPPATIPLFYLPHFVDSFTHGPNHEANWYHLNYSQVYRGQLLLVDIFLFWLIYQVNKKYIKEPKLKWLNLLSYLLVTTKAHHFLYDTMDLTFAATVTLSAAAALVWPAGQLNDFGRWLGFWLGTALKLMNAPLLLVHLTYTKLVDWQKFAIAGVAALLVWAAPVLMYRSSLQVIWVYHQQRGIQVDSVAGLVLRIATRVTHTEHIAEVYKNYEIAGPMTSQWLPLVSAFQFLSFAVFGLWAGWYMWRLKNMNSKNIFLLASTLGFILTFLLVGKVQSTPFLLWLPPLLSCYKWPSWRAQLLSQLALIVIIFSSMTRMPNTELGLLTLPIVIVIVRTSLLLALFIGWVKTLSTVVASEAHTPATKAGRGHR